MQNKIELYAHKLTQCAVASSKIRILFLRRMARAKQTRLLCPTLKFDALSCTRQSKPFGNELTAALKSTYFAIKRTDAIF